MAWLRKTKGVPGSAPGGLEWHTTEDVVEVEDGLAVELLEIPDAGFLSVPPPAAAEEEGDGAEVAPESEKAVPAKPARKTAAKAPAKTEVQE